MEVQLKTGEVINIIRLIPKPLHALGLTLRDAGQKPKDIKIYFSDVRQELVDKSFDSLPYIQFKADPLKSKSHYKPVYNDLEQAHQFCFIQTDVTHGVNSEVVLHH